MRERTSPDAIEFVQAAAFALDQPCRTDLQVQDRQRSIQECISIAKREGFDWEVEVDQRWVSESERQGHLFEPDQPAGKRQAVRKLGEYARVTPALLLGYIVDLLHRDTAVSSFSIQGLGRDPHAGTLRSDAPRARLPPFSHQAGRATVLQHFMARTDFPLHSMTVRRLVTSMLGPAADETSARHYGDLLAAMFRAHGRDVERATRHSLDSMADEIHARHLLLSEAALYMVARLGAVVDPAPLVRTHDYRGRDVTKTLGEFLIESTVRASRNDIELLTPAFASLRGRGIDPDAVNPQTGRTMLHAAVQMASANFRECHVLERLIEVVDDVEAVDKEGRTPLDLARDTHTREVLVRRIASDRRHKARALLSAAAASARAPDQGT